VRVGEGVVVSLLGIKASSFPLTHWNSHPFPTRNRRQAAAINRYARGEVDHLDVVEAKRWSALGVLLTVLGLVSAAFAVLLGPLSSTWSDSEDEEGESGKSR